MRGREKREGGGHNAKSNFFVYESLASGWNFRPLALSLFGLGTANPGLDSGLEKGHNVEKSRLAALSSCK